MPKELSITPDEKFMLHLLDTGMCDGVVGRPYKTANGYIISYGITCGIPEKYISHPNKIGYQNPRPVQRYTADGQRLVFLMKFGHYMPDEIFQEYSKASGMAITLPKSPRELAEEAKAKEVEALPPKTETELRLLRRLSAGEFDGSINHGWIVKGGSWHWCVIENGIPIQYSQAKDSKFFNNKETETIEAPPKVYKKYLTDDEKLEFFRKFGRDMEDDEAFNYSWRARQKRYNLY